MRAVTALAAALTLLLAGCLLHDQRPGRRGCCQASAMHTGDVGTCVECGTALSTGTHRLCDPCAERTGRCTHCLRLIDW